MNCYCRGIAVCPDCGGHECAGQCTCNRDGAPITQESVTTGWAPQTNHHQENR